MLSHVIYTFSCASCNTCYIGETHRHFLVRVHEHLNTDKNSAVYKHVNANRTCKALCNSDCFTILDKATTKYQLRIKEAIKIHDIKLELNKQLYTLIKYLFCSSLPWVWPSYVCYRVNWIYCYNDDIYWNRWMFKTEFL